MSAWTADRIEILMPDGVRSVRGYVSAAAPGLAVTPDPRQHGFWTVTHIPSGRALEPCSTDAENVMGLALELATLGDWGRDADALWSDAALWNALDAVAERALASGEYQCFNRALDEGMPLHIRSRVEARRSSRTAATGAA